MKNLWKKIRWFFIRRKRKKLGFDVVHDGTGEYTISFSPDFEFPVGGIKVYADEPLVESDAQKILKAYVDHVGKEPNAILEDILWKEIKDGAYKYVRDRGLPQVKFRGTEPKEPE